MQRVRSRSVELIDKRLCQRISEYVDTQPKQKYIPTQDVIAYLQLKFPEYNRKKKKTLTAFVQKYLQEILLERYGPQTKKIRTKTILVEDNSASSAESELEDLNTLPLMIINNVNSLNNTMHGVYQQSQSQPCSPHLERRDSRVASVPNSPKQLQKRGNIGYIIDRQPGNHSIAIEQAFHKLQHVQNIQHKSMEEYLEARKELNSGDVIADEIAEEEFDEISASKSSEVFGVIKEQLNKSVQSISLASEEAERKGNKKSKMQKKTVISVEDLTPCKNDMTPGKKWLLQPKRNNKPDEEEENYVGSSERRKSAPHYSRRYNSDASKKERRKSEFYDHEKTLSKHKTRPTAEGLCNNEEDDPSGSRCMSGSIKPRSSRMTGIRSSSAYDREYRNLVQTSTTFQDIAGVDNVLEEISRLLIHLLHPEIFTTLGVKPTQGILLHGPPGCGKTLLANAIAGQMNLPLFSVTGTELVSGFSGESEHNIRSLFRQARSLAPSILFIDEIDSICGKREDAQKDMEKRIVTQLLSCIDDLGNLRKGGHVLLLAATNRPDNIDGSMRRAGRLDKEICLGIPNEKQRIAILRKLCSTLKLDDSFDFYQVAHNTPGYVAADLVALIREASLNAISRSLPQIIEHKTANDVTMATSSSSCDSEYYEKPLKTCFRSLLGNINTVPFSNEKLSTISISLLDFLEAVKYIQPSAKREGFATVPDVTWDDVGALVEVREELAISILAPVKYPEKFAALGLTRSQGILIAGPPGCGKTLLAKAVANESGINFISVKGPELLNMYVGESERAVRTVFQRARASAPCVIFFDEIDSLVPKRSASEGTSSARVVNQLLTEMDGLESRKNVFIIGATNRIDIIDPAVLRPGRLDKTLFVNLPNATDRLAILQTMTRSGKPKLHSDVSLREIADACHGYTGADLSAVLREASILCLKADMLAGKSGDNCIVCKEHFTRALMNVSPSVSLADISMYEQMSKRGRESVAL